MRHTVYEAPVTWQGLRGLEPLTYECAFSLQEWELHTDKRQAEVEEGVSLQCSVGEREDYRESVGTNLGTFAGTKGSNNGRL